MNLHVRALGLVVGASMTAAAAAEAVRLETPSGTLHGTLRMPTAAPPVPVALIIAGSGPTDRDGNSTQLPGKNDSLRLLAEALADAGIASVRYDKRGVGASTAAAASEASMRFDDFVGDAAAWADQLSKDARFTRLAIVGHSEGALIGMLAARRVPAVAAYVSVAGPAERASDVLRRQLKGKLPDELWNASQAILASLEAGRQVHDIPGPLASLFRPSVQPYLVSWFRYTPRVEIAALAVPCLIVQGTTDLQVSPADAAELQRAQPGCSSLTVTGMNHVLKSVPLEPARQAASYADPQLPLHPELAGPLIRFLRASLGGAGK